MLYTFLANNRDELIRRCAARVAERPQRGATQEQLQNGIPIFLGQLTKTLAADEEGENATSERISGSPQGVAPVRSEMSVTASAHGKDLLKLGYTVDQVVHDYGDLCQAVTDLAYERDAPFAVAEFRTLNRCLDNAIADAVREFSFHRDEAREESQSAETNERLGHLMHELRNALQTGNLSVRALELGNLPVSGSTGSVLKRSMANMSRLIDQALGEVRANGPASEHSGVFSLAELIAVAQASGELRAQARGCTFVVPAVDATIGIRANYALLLSAVENLLQNAFKFTQEHTEVRLAAYALGERVLIEVADHCGGLPAGDMNKMFIPFFQQSSDKSGVGLGLAMARRAIEADGGELTVKDLPGVGCVFKISLPRHTLK